MVGEPEAVFSGSDSSGWVRIDLDGAGRVVAADVVDDSTRCDPVAFGAAVVMAHHAAGIARLAGWTPDARVVTDRPPMPDDRGPQARVDHVMRVGADLREYGLQLAERLDSRVVGRSAGNEVSAVLQGSRLVSVTVDHCSTGPRPGLGRWVCAAVQDAVRQQAEADSTAMDGCPDLAELLGRTR